MRCHRGARLLQLVATAKAPIFCQNTWKSGSCDVVGIGGRAFCLFFATVVQGKRRGRFRERSEGASWRLQQLVDSARNTREHILKAASVEAGRPLTYAVWRAFSVGRNDAHLLLEDLLASNELPTDARGRLSVCMPLLVRARQRKSMREFVDVLVRVHAEELNLGITWRAIWSAIRPFGQNWPLLGALVRECDARDLPCARSGVLEGCFVRELVLFEQDRLWGDFNERELRRALKSILEFNPKRPMPAAAIYYRLRMLAVDFAEEPRMLERVVAAAQNVEFFASKLPSAVGGGASKTDDDSDIGYFIVGAMQVASDGFFLKDLMTFTRNLLEVCKTRAVRVSTARLEQMCSYVGVDMDDQLRALFAELSSGNNALLSIDDLVELTDSAVSSISEDVLTERNTRQQLDGICFAIGQQAARDDLTFDQASSITESFNKLRMRLTSATLFTTSEQRDPIRNVVSRLIKMHLVVTKNFAVAEELWNWGHRHGFDTYLRGKSLVELVYYRMNEGRTTDALAMIQSSAKQLESKKPAAQLPSNSKLTERCKDVVTAALRSGEQVEFVLALLAALVDAHVLDAERAPIVATPLLRHLCKDNLTRAIDVFGRLQQTYGTIAGQIDLLLAAVESNDRAALSNLLNILTSMRGERLAIADLCEALVILGKLEEAADLCCKMDAGRPYLTTEAVWHMVRRAAIRRDADFLRRLLQMHAAQRPNVAQFQKDANEIVRGMIDISVNRSGDISALAPIESLAETHGFSLTRENEVRLENARRESQSPNPDREQKIVFNPLL